MRNQHSFGRNVPDISNSQSMRANIADNLDRTDNNLFTNFGICNQKPKYPQFALLTVRRASYREFPPEVAQAPEELAKAGFFYSGREDVVYCFFCGQGLKSWEPDDDPWIEHARWSPQCLFLIQLKGNDFVSMIQIAHSNPNQEYGSTQEPMEIAAPHANEVIRGIKTDCVSEVNDYMGTVAAQSLLTNGYDPDKVKLAIGAYIRQNKGLEFTATDLLHTLFAIEDGTIEPETPTEPIIVTENSNKHQKEEILPETGNHTIEDDIQALRNENKQLKDQTICKICMEEIVSIVFLPCGHLCACAECAPALRKCPICRVFIKGTVKTFIA